MAQDLRCLYQFDFGTLKIQADLGLAMVFLFLDVRCCLHHTLTHRMRTTIDPILL